MVAVSLLHGLGKLRPNDAVLLSDGPEAFCHAALHTFQAAHVDVGLLILHQLPEFFGILGHLGLDVHLLSSRILVLTAHGVVIAELIWVLLLVGLMLVVIQQGLGIWHTHEEPSNTLELASSVGGSTGLVVEKQPQVGTHGCNARACGKHNDVGLRVLWQQHLCTGGACDEHLVSWCHVADVVGAHATVDLVLREGSARLVRLILALGAVAELAIQLHYTLHTQRNRLGALIITHCRRGNGVEPDLRWLLALLVGARCDDSNGLALNVRDLASMVEGHMSGFPVGISSGLCQGLWVKVIGNDLALVRSLRGKEVPWNLLAMHHLHPLLLHGRCAANGGPSHGRHHRQAAHGAAGSAARHPAAPGPGRGGTAQGGIRGAGSAGQQEVCFHAGFTNHGSRPNDCDHRERLS
mmetsp:Transcript_64779/g.131664  ORF Transcript_64779/g.131664 Transcript_64779/m.131664 type:complete len:409 (+) Transcript_64779:194-1420(+)